MTRRRFALGASFEDLVKGHQHVQQAFKRMGFSADNQPSINETNMPKTKPTPTKELAANARPFSFAAFVGSLEPGECASRTLEVSPSANLFELPAQLPLLKEQARNNVVSAVRAAKEMTGGQYRVEVSELLTHAGNLYIVVIITRTA